MKIIIVALSLLALANSQLTQSEKDRIVSEHNALRQRTANGQTPCANGQNCPAMANPNNMKTLIWDEGLARLAQGLADSCVYGHEENDVRAARFQSLGGSNNFPGQYKTGENLATGWSSSWSSSTGSVKTYCSAGECSGRSVTERWGDDEALLWTHDDNTINNCIGGWTECGHFTQIIWADTQYIGCGFKRTETSGCQDVGILACNYYPGGNWQGQGPYPAASSSSIGTPAQPDDDDSDTDSTPCLHMDGSPWNGYFDGQWVEEGDHYRQGQWLLKWNDYGSTGYWGVQSASGSLYLYCYDSSRVVSIEECVAGEWNNVAVSVNFVSCSVGAFTLGEIDESDPAAIETVDAPQSNNDGWKIVLVVVIAGLLLIAAGNVAYCVYMKRVMTPKHNMAKMEKILEEERDEIEIQCEVETSH